MTFTARDFNRMKGRIVREAVTNYGVRVLGEGPLTDRLLDLDEKMRVKIIQNAIKPLTKRVRQVWRSEIKAANVSGTRSGFRSRYGNISLRAALAKSVKARNPAGSGKKALRGYVSLGGATTKHGKKGEATTNAGQMYWMEYGTTSHDQPRRGWRHPGARPITKVRRRMKGLEPVALRFFRKAILEGIETDGATIKAKRQYDLWEATQFV